MFAIHSKPYCVLRTVCENHIVNWWICNSGLAYDILHNTHPANLSVFTQITCRGASSTRSICLRKILTPSSAVHHHMVVDGGLCLWVIICTHHMMRSPKQAAVEPCTRNDTFVLYLICIDVDATLAVRNSAVASRPDSFSRCDGFAMRTGYLRRVCVYGSLSKEHN